MLNPGIFLISKVLKNLSILASPSLRSEFKTSIALNIDSFLDVNQVFVKHSKNNSRFSGLFLGISLSLSTAIDFKILASVSNLLFNNVLLIILPYLDIFSDTSDTLLFSTFYSFVFIPRYKTIVIDQFNRRY